MSLYRDDHTPQRIKVASSTTKIRAVGIGTTELVDLLSELYAHGLWWKGMQVAGIRTCCG